jgi:hypothetical protein
MHSRLALVVLGVLLATAVEAGEQQGGRVVTGYNGLKGEIRSGAIRPNSGTVAPILTAPAAGSGRLVLTQVCTGDDDPATEVLVRVNGLAAVAKWPASTEGPSCITFDPGISVPASQTVECEVLPGGVSEICTATGIIVPE